MSSKLIQECQDVLANRLKELYGEGPLDPSKIDWSIVLCSNKSNRESHTQTTLRKVEDLLGQAEGMNQEDPMESKIFDLQQDIYTAMCETSNIRAGEPQ